MTGGGMPTEFAAPAECHRPSWELTNDEEESDDGTAHAGEEH